MESTPSTTDPLASTLSTERKEYLHTLFTAALEGGIGYWSECTVYRWSTGDSVTADIDGFYAIIKPHDNEWGVSHLRTGYGLDENEPIRIDLEVMHHGALLFWQYCTGELDSHGKPVPTESRQWVPEAHYWRQWMVQNITNGAEGDSDAEVADQIVQWGLFGEAVYG